jgi:hypothetical protein
MRKNRREALEKKDLIDDAMHEYENKIFTRLEFI